MALVVVQVDFGGIVSLSKLSLSCRGHEAVCLHALIAIMYLGHLVWGAASLTSSGPFNSDSNLDIDGRLHVFRLKHVCGKLWDRRSCYTN
ncbi:hypothetical protein BDR06DRAFT_731851 [Suillus hirtellus]|nr:hypothetical protein BDR06DRAFT_731851 [Suillus hirtellus]